MGRHSSKSNSPFGRKHDRHISGEPRRKPTGRSPRDAMPAVKRQPSEGAGQRLADPSGRRRGSLETAPARLKAERDRRRRRTKTVLFGLLGAFVIALVVGGASLYAYAKHIERTMQKTIVKEEQLDAALTQAKPQEPYTVLLLGADYRPGEKIYRTDTIILCRIDPQTKQVWMVSIPRDTRVEIPGHGTAKINQAHYYGGEKGGAELTIKTVEKFTGVPINHYMEVNFRGFEKAVDALGGVWVDVPTEIDDWKAASHSPGHRAKHIDAGYQLLDGEHALTFVRSRDYADADFSRMKSQQIFFKALADQVAKTGNVARLPRVVSSVAPYITTDMSLVDMIRTAQALRGAGSKSIHTATITGEWRSPYVWADEQKMAEIIKKFKAGQSFEPTAAPASNPASTTAKAGGAAAAPPAKDPEDIKVTIRNGAGIAGCAKQAASILRAQEFNVGEVGNTNQFVYDTTLVVYKSDAAAAKLVAMALPPGTKLVESRGMYSFDSDVLVVIGKDWDIAKVPVAPVKTR